jgi:hypothetical protein
MRMPRSSATAAALMRFTFSEPLQQAFNGRVAYQVSFCLGERSAIGKVNGLDAALAGLREERAKAAREINVGREDLRYSSWLSEGRLTAFCTTPSLRYSRTWLGDLDADGFLGFGGGSGDVGRENDVVQADGRATLWEARSAKTSNAAPPT